MEPVAKRTDALVLLLEASKALAYNALFLATLAFVAKLNGAPESIRTIIGSGYPFTLAVTTTRLDRAAATERHRSVVSGTCSFCEAGEELTSLTEERTIIAAALSGLTVATDVSVQHDATYSIDASRGAICSGEGTTPAGTACPLKGDVATAACIPGLPSYTAIGCVAPIDGHCAIVTGSTWGCVFPSGSHQAEDNTPCPSLPVPIEVAQDTPCPSLPVAGSAVDTPCPKLQLPSESSLAGSAVYLGQAAQSSNMANMYQQGDNPVGDGGNAKGYDNYNTALTNSAQNIYLGEGSHDYYNGHDAAGKEEGSLAAYDHHGSSGGYEPQQTNDIHGTYRDGSEQWADERFVDYGTNQTSYSRAGYGEEQDHADSYSANSHDEHSCDQDGESQDSINADENDGSYVIDQGEGSQEDFSSGQKDLSYGSDAIDGSKAQNEGSHESYFVHQGDASHDAADSYDFFGGEQAVEEYSADHAADSTADDLEDEAPATYDAGEVQNLHEEYSANDDASGDGSAENHSLAEAGQSY
ncbi:unnamed protein product [Phytophthora fragariaefolia]|uniref:Unnamed protein product n=1 Tax=Phytophthora fragariaefolia TaxID=1490495 RepID=A0A9W6UAE6_9STRA|nr:unnamed protein product [Phytophthora fragariaefolia]